MKKFLENLFYTILVFLGFYGLFFREEPMPGEWNEYKITQMCALVMMAMGISALYYCNKKKEDK